MKAAARGPADDLIVRAGQSDLEALTKVIVRAFFNIAPCIWLFPDEQARSKRLPVLLRAQVQHALEHGIVYTTEDRSAAALWYIHHGGAHHADPEYAARLAEAVGPDHAERLHAFEAATHAARPTEPHDYLFVAAVDPDRQRRGIGSKLLDAAHRDLAVAGRPAYLEASDAGTRSVYLGLDYRDANGPDLVLPGTPPTRLFPMRRPWIPCQEQRVTVIDDVAGWGGADGRVLWVRSLTSKRPAKVAVDGDNDPRDFALNELRPQHPHDPMLMP